jgi:hypothetical protein
VQLLLSPVVAACDGLDKKGLEDLLAGTVFQPQGPTAGGRTALRLAARRGNVRVVAPLLDMLDLPYVSGWVRGVSG